jgi:hypothetical protein
VAKRKARGKSKPAKLSSQVSTKRARIVTTLPDAQGTPQQLIRDGIQFIKCSICGFHVPTNRVKEHEEKCLRLWKKKNSRNRSGTALEPKFSSPSLRRTSPSPASKSSALIQCALCRCQLREKNLARHMRRTHASEIARVELPRTVHTRAASNKSETTAPEPDHCDPRDASKYIGHFARDHGSFGSMPAYDDFSDEGSPD